MDKEINITKGNCDYCLEEYKWDKSKRHEPFCYLHADKKEIGLCKEHLLQLYKYLGKFIKENKLEEL